MELYKKYHDSGLEILAFPCNQFGKQEPLSEAKIKLFVTEKYGVTFPMFSKIDVNGKNAHPIFQFLRKKLPGTLGTSIKWNFTKFLCNRDGIPVKRYGPPTKPFTFEDTIKAMLETSDKGQKNKPSAEKKGAKADSNKDQKVDANTDQKVKVQNDPTEDTQKEQKVDANTEQKVDANTDQKEDAQKDQKVDPFKNQHTDAQQANAVTEINADIKADAHKDQKEEKDTKADAQQDQKDAGHKDQVEIHKDQNAEKDQKAENSNANTNTETKTGSGN